MNGFNGSVSLSCSTIAPAADSIPFLHIQPNSVPVFRNCNADGLHTATTRSFRHAHSLLGQADSDGRPQAATCWWVFFYGVPSRRRRGAAGLALVVLVLLVAGVSCGGASKGSGGRRLGERRRAVHVHGEGNQRFAAVLSHRQLFRNGAVVTRLGFGAGRCGNGTGSISAGC